MKHILFVCTGNTCRSPMAEGMLRKLAIERGLELEVRSAGVAAMEGAPISRHAEAVLREQDILDRMTSTPLSNELAEWAHLILTLTQGHKQHVIQRLPHTAGKVFTLKEYVEDRDAVLKDVQELDGLYASQQLMAALGQELSTQERERMIELHQRIPSADISDPFGGSREDYDVTAAEIRTALHKLLDKLKASSE
ncbi:low molecular weight protein arginine phosphatase [Paenibacillus farraposensis]|uniref:Low molecular weight protein arginine phosphatase n=1 Tax=Paenibacillus farraposensis TaxID=2807095 RepID=A0ABW4DHS6_9BACL|nr:low molecular weight protein arginine phosphatase [Paenibacillus farraposensis]MCC3379427.1 low molecular weight protein arginine phosphatase [Paenibacillus farraposensis]